MPEMGEMRFLSQHYWTKGSLSDGFLLAFPHRLHQSGMAGNSGSGQELKERKRNEYDARVEGTVCEGEKTHESRQGESMLSY